jgi:hypothetical protein
VSCPECCGLGTTGEAIRCFPDTPTLEAVAGPKDWVKCPGCAVSFAVYDRSAWTGLRHTTCGQRITLIQPEDPRDGDPPKEEGAGKS